MRILFPTVLFSFGIMPLHASLFSVSSQEPIAPRFVARAFQKNTSTLSCAVTQTRGNRSYNATGTPTPFLEQYGTPLISNFYKGLTPSRTLSTAYFADHGTHSLVNSTDVEGDDASEYVPVNATLRFTNPDNYYSFTSFHLAYTHYLFSGLFLRLNTQLSDGALRAKTISGGAQAENTRVRSFADAIDTVLAENGHPPLTYNHTPLALQRAGFSIGWHGSTCLQDNFIQEIEGTLLTGYTFAPTHFDNPLAPGFLINALTHGYSAECDLAIQVSNHIGIEAAAATTIYGRYSDTMHIVRDDTSKTTYFAGPPLLGSGKVRKDPGTLWVFECGLSANRFHGFYITGGYHFSYQEATRLALQDTTVLQGSTWEGTKLSSLPSQQDARLNSDPRLGNWKHHSMFIRAGFAPSVEHRLVPHFDFGVYFPVMGHRAVSPTRIYTGSGQLSLRWTF